MQSVIGVTLESDTQALPGAVGVGDITGAFPAVANMLRSRMAAILVVAVIAHRLAPGCHHSALQAWAISSSIVACTVTCRWV